MPPGLRSLQFFPSMRCNQACDFCFNRGIAPKGEIDAGRFSLLLDVMSGSGIPELDLLGGEPTLLPFLPEAIAEAISRKIKVNISSNGTNVPMLTTLAQRFPPDQLMIGISVNDDPLPESLSVFIKAFRPALKSICSHGQTIPDSAYRYLDLPRVEYYHIFRDALRPGDLDATLPYSDFRRELSLLQSRHANVHGVVCGGFVPDLDDAPELEGARCPAGTTKLSVMPDGSVYPCYLLFRNPEFRLGNILTDPFETIWENKILRFFRLFQGNRCGTTICRYYASCHGGCPAVSLLVTGELFAPDPRCSANDLHYCRGGEELAFGRASR